MAIDLPPLLTAYVTAKNAHDVEGQLACFAPDAIVHDEGEELHGTDEVRTWIQRTTDAYDLTVEPIALAESSGETVMTALVSGDFPGSPLEFRYFLRITDAGIAGFRTET